MGYMGVLDMVAFQVNKKKAKAKEEKIRCKICGELMSINGLSDRPGICKLCGSSI
jgi:formylmethanofuran dehydrogenase subunit E